MIKASDHHTSLWGARSVFIALLTLAGAAAGLPGQLGNEFPQIVSRAQGYLRERRFRDALTALQQAYQLKKDSDVLAQMVTTYLALGMLTEAEETAAMVLGQGGQITFLCRHNHARGSCFGSLIVGRDEIRWTSNTAQDAFQSSRSDLSVIQISTSSTAEDTGNEAAGAIPTFRMKAGGRNWLFEYLLYGPGSYRTTLSGTIAYFGEDAPRAEAATKLIGLAIGGSIGAAPVRSEATAADGDTRSDRTSSRERQGQVKDGVESVDSGNLVDDPIVAEYVNRVSQNIVRNADARMPVLVKVLNADAVDCTAPSRSLLLVSKALIRELDDESQMAGIIAHAIGHIGAKEREDGERSPALARPDSPEARELKEAQADVLGVQYLFKTGYEPGSVVAAMEKLEALRHQFPARIAPQFQAHLMTGSRLAAARSQAEKLRSVRSESVMSTSEFDEVRRRVVTAPQEGGVRPPPAAATSSVSVQIRTGMSKEEVLRVLGAPVKEIVFGSKAILKFAEVTVEFVGGKVVDLKPN